MVHLLYELAGADGRCFSPHCWRARMALAHKGADWSTQRTLFTQIGQIDGGRQKTVPVLEDGGTFIGDSWKIAEHLETRYPDQPSLFGGDTGKHLARFVHEWTATQLLMPLLRMIVADVYDHLAPADQSYFRSSREQRLHAPLESTRDKRDAELPVFRAALAPLRTTIGSQAFLGGAMPTYADYVVFGAFQWSRLVSPFRLLESDDPVAAWFARCLDLHEGLGRRERGYWPV